MENVGRKETKKMAYKTSFDCRVKVVVTRSVDDGSRLLRWHR